MRIAGVVSTLTVVISGIPSDASACSCEPPPPPQEALRQSVAAFSGTVSGIDEWATESDGTFFKVTLFVQEIWKGASGDESAIVTATDDARCGYAFTVGSSYLVYAHGFRTESERLPATGLCRGGCPSSDHGLNNRR